MGWCIITQGTTSIILDDEPRIAKPVSDYDVEQRLARELQAAYDAEDQPDPDAPSIQDMPWE